MVRAVGETSDFLSVRVFFIITYIGDWSGLGFVFLCVFFLLVSLFLRSTWAVFVKGPLLSVFFFSFFSDMAMPQYRNIAI